ncbi:MAG: TetR/AcrR family transcriptional regulator [Dehalococcoidia bacterium]
MAYPPEITARTVASDTRIEAILTTAERMFFEKGFRGISVRDLAAEVGFKMSSLYHYFDSKEAILYQIIRRHLDDLLELTELDRLGFAADAPSEDKLRALVSRSIGHLLRSRMAAQVAASQTRELDGERAGDITKSVAEFEGRFLVVIREGVERGEFDAHDSKIASFVILGALIRITEWYKPEGRLSADEIADTYTDMLVRGLLAPRRAACPA